MSFFFVIGSGKSEGGFLRFVSPTIFAANPSCPKDNRRNKGSTLKKPTLSRRLFERSGRGRLPYKLFSLRTNLSVLSERNECTAGYSRRNSDAKGLLELIYMVSCILTCVSGSV
jgi:hypothetical protein